VAAVAFSGAALLLTIDETGDPQTLQNDAPSEITDPHFEHAAIIPPFPKHGEGLPIH
jgi:hypothetical protein